jgi:hypothetical protein
MIDDRMQFMKRFLFWIFTFSSLLSMTAYSATLIGWAEMPMHVYAQGPTSNQFNHANDVARNHQVVQGFSAVLKTGVEDQFYFLVDNGFGYKNNSADALLRLYEVNIVFSKKDNKNNSLQIKRYINLNDSDKKLGYKIQADYRHYYDVANNPDVPSEIKSNRLLTGADVDPESIQIDKHGHFWIGDEFGPFLIEADVNGKLLSPEWPLAGVQSPENPYLHNAKPNMQSSAGFEAMAINPSRDTLYPMLENALDGDDSSSLRIYQFDINEKKYKPGYFFYKLDENATNATDMVAVNNHQFLVLERNTATKDYDHPLKKVFLIDIQNVENEAYVNKTELVDLMQLDDPDDLNSDGEKTYAFAYSHLEDLMIIDNQTLLIANDNNYAGRTYFIKVRLDKPLLLESFAQPDLSKASWKDSQQTTPLINFDDHSFYGWMTVLAYFLASLRAGYKAKLAWIKKEHVIFWVGLTLMMIALGLNKQLDLQSNFTEILRDMAKAHGWYEQRRMAQMLFVAAMGICVPVILIVLRLTLVQSWRRFKVIWVGMILLLVFIVIRAASFHHVDLFFYQSVGSLRYYQALEMLAIAVIFIGTYFENTAALLRKAKKQSEQSDLPKSAGRRIVEITQEGESIVCPACGAKPVAAAVDGRVFKCKSCQQVYQVQLKG